MKGFHLKQEELEELHDALKLERNKRYAYRMYAVILLGTGYTLKKVKQVLFIDDETLRNYVDNYRIDGIPGLLSDNRGGRACKLSAEQIAVLEVDLDSTIHLHTGTLIKFVSHLVARNALELDLETYTFYQVQGSIYRRK